MCAHACFCILLYVIKAAGGTIHCCWNMQTLTCPWNVFVNERQSSLLPSLSPHWYKCHGLPNGANQYVFAIQEEVRLSFGCLGDYKSIASCSIFWSIPNEKCSVATVVIRAGMEAEVLESPVLWLATADNEQPIEVFVARCTEEACLWMNQAHASRINTQHNCGDEQTHQFKRSDFSSSGCRSWRTVTFGLRQRACAAFWRRNKQTTKERKKSRKRKRVGVITFPNQQNWQQVWIHVCIFPADILVSTRISFTCSHVSAAVVCLIFLPLFFFFLFLLDGNQSVKH